MSSNVKPVLERALDLIADADHWAKDAEAYDDQDGPVHPHDESAVKFCSIGAIFRACYELEAYSASKEVVRALGGYIHSTQGHDGWSHNWEDDIVAFNDDESTTHEDVVLTFKHAIHTLEEMSDV